MGKKEGKICEKILLHDYKLTFYQPLFPLYETIHDNYGVTQGRYKKFLSTCATTLSFLRVNKTEKTFQSKPPDKER